MRFIPTTTAKVEALKKQAKRLQRNGGGKHADPVDDLVALEPQARVGRGGDQRLEREHGDLVPPRHQAPRERPDVLLGPRHVARQELVDDEQDLQAEPVPIVA